MVDDGAMAVCIPHNMHTPPVPAARIGLNALPPNWIWELILLCLNGIGDALPYTKKAGRTITSMTWRLNYN